MWSPLASPRRSNAVTLGGHGVRQGCAVTCAWRRRRERTYLPHQRVRSPRGCALLGWQASCLDAFPENLLWPIRDDRPSWFPDAHGASDMSSIDATPTPPAVSTDAIAMPPATGLGRSPDRLTQSERTLNASGDETDSHIEYPTEQTGMSLGDDQPTGQP